MAYFDPDFEADLAEMKSRARSPRANRSYKKQIELRGGPTSTFKPIFVLLWYPGPNDHHDHLESGLTVAIKATSGKYRGQIAYQHYGQGHWVQARSKKYCKLEGKRQYDD